MLRQRHLQHCKGLSPQASGLEQHSHYMKQIKERLNELFLCLGDSEQRRALLQSENFNLHNMGALRQNKLILFQ